MEAKASYFEGNNPGLKRDHNYSELQSRSNPPYYENIKSMDFLDEQP